MNTVIDTPVAAHAAGLRYVRDAQPGIKRIKRGIQFCYARPDGKPVRAREDLRRIRSLAIPPAWTNVWICPSANGHLQATGRDAKGRKQYRYHSRWRTVRDHAKFGRMIEFAQALPKLRTTTAAHLAAPGLPREKVLATIVQLLERTLIRVGNEEYVQANGSYGLTTFEDRHADVRGDKVRFEFRGKSGKDHSISVDDRRLAKIVKRCQDLPGCELFQYVDTTGRRQSIDSGDVNQYLKEITGRDFTAKDFRTWFSTVLATVALRELGPFASQREAKRKISQAITAVSAMLGNTPAVCRKCYIHPVILDLYTEGSLFPACNGSSRAMHRYGLRPDEKLVLRLLRECKRDCAPKPKTRP